MAMKKNPAAFAERSRQLYRAVLSLRGMKECERFFQDLCSISELESMAARWHVARELHHGRTYQEVSQITKSSTTTVTRAAYWMRHGTGGLRIALERLAGKHARRHANKISFKKR